VGEWEGGRVELRGGSGWRLNSGVEVESLHPAHWVKRMRRRRRAEGGREERCRGTWINCHPRLPCTNNCIRLDTLLGSWGAGSAARAKMVK
jgi:hypothetical protein